VNTWRPRRYVAGHHSIGSLAADYRVDELSGCWLWQRATDYKGYGVTNRGGVGRAIAGTTSVMLGLSPPA